MIKYNKDVIKILKQSEKETYELNDSKVTINHFILATLKLDNNIKKIFNKFHVDYKTYINNMTKNEINRKSDLIFYSLKFKKILDLSYDTANKYQSNEIKLEHIFITIIDENIELELLTNINLNIETFYKELLNSLNKSNEIIKEIGTNLTDLAKNKKLSNIIGREKEINQIIEILARKNKNNPILIGEAGVGKTAIVEELANLISNNNVPKFLKNKQIISINISSIISGTKYRGEFEEKLNKILKECETKDNIILFVDEIHTIVGAGGAEGAIDASNILKPSLARGTIKLIGATTISEYKKTIATDKALDRRFQKVIINTPNKEETYNILKSIKNEYEEFHNVKISDKLLKKISDLSDKYILDRNNPDKSIDILDEVCASTSVIKNHKIIHDLRQKISYINKIKENALKKGNYLKAYKCKEEEENILNKINTNLNYKKDVSLNTIIEIIESKCNSKIYDINTNKNYKFLRDNLNKKIVGQENEINCVINRLKILNMKKDNLPISILINGPSGTGKTSFAIEFSKITGRNLIKLNMNDFQNEMSINKIIGSPQGYIGYDDNNTVLEDLKLNPNSIILLDEIDKANINIINLFSKIIEEGIIKNSKNEIFNLKNTFIIMTSNNTKCKPIGYINKSKQDETLSDNFIENIDFILNFKELSEDSIKKIINNYIKDFNHNYNTNIKLNNKEIENIIDKSSYKENGAKSIKKLLNTYLEKELLSITSL